nr:hypothetical protein [Tanacetum cinerariifolium]
MELKKIFIEKMEGNKSIQRSDEQRNLYKALVEAYEADKAILDTYGDSPLDQTGGPNDKKKEESRHQLALHLKKQPRTTCQMEETLHSVFDTGADDQPIIQTSQHPEWFSQPRKPPSPDRAWNTALPAAQGDAQSWISDLARQADARSSFNELLDTPIDFSNFIMYRLNVDTLTPDLLAGPTYELMRGSCTSLTELEYHLEEVYKATTDQLDWFNPEGQQYPHNLLQPLPLIPDNRGRRVIPFEHFINNDLEYLWRCASSRKYPTSVTKTKAADYGHIKWIEDLVPREMWIQQPIDYNKHALWGVSHWGQKRKQFYGTMATTIEQQVALDEALVPNAQRLRIGRSNFRLPSDIQSKEPTLQVVYDVLFKMDTRKNVLDLEAFREMLHISPRVPGQSFTKLPFEEEILEFLRFLGHSAQIKTLTDVNVNKLYQPWRSFAVVINKCLTGKIFGIDSLRNTNAYKEYYACATGEETSKPKASARKKQISSASSTTPPTLIATPTPTTTVQGGSSTYEGTGSRPGVSNVPSDDLEEEISWNSSDDEDVDDQTKDSDEKDGETTDESDDDDDDQEETKNVNDDDDEESKIGEQEATKSDEGEDEATKKSEDDSNNEEDQGLRIGKEERIREEEEADELYRDVDINQGRGLQVSQETEDSHVILTLTQSDGQQESSSTSSFVTNLQNPIIDPGMESIFTTGLSTVTLIPSPQSTMTPSIMTTTTTISQPPIPSLDLQNLLTFASGIVHQYMHQQMPEAVREAVQTQTDRLQDSIQREKDEFLKTIDDNMKKIIKEQALVEAYDADKTILDTYRESAILKRRREDDDQEGPSAGSDRGSKRRRDGWEHASASTPSEPATRSAGRHTTGTQSDSCLPVSLLLQRNLCRLPVRWRSPHIRCLRQVQKINPLFKLLNILNGSHSKGTTNTGS